MASHTLWLVLICTVCCCLIMVCVWLWARRISNAGIVDIAWAYNFAVIAGLIFIFGEGIQTRKTLICALVAVASIRLGTHLAKRVLKHINEEEGRYAHLRQKWQPTPNRSFFWFFQAQAISNVLLAVPFFIIASNTKPMLGVLELMGAAIWLISLIGESLADYQLQQFKADTSNKGKVCDTGLWHYSRHPNYFFEWLTWVGYFIIALNAPYGYLAIISPAIILYLLLKVTGIPATEEQSLRSKGEAFKAYQQTTSVFMPWFKKH